MSTPVALRSRRLVASCAAPTLASGRAAFAFDPQRALT